MRPADRAHHVRRRRLIDAIKLAQGCWKCGYQGHPAALDFDHIGVPKLFNISQQIRAAWHRLVDEMAKCRVLCANCHRIETHATNAYHSKRRPGV